ncbi:MAG: hypothetical protein QOD96_5168, partial [Pseudonocardiales bacterium]|nr:hypothetical protein [Pseudonocardiales bacterium]
MTPEVMAKVTRRPPTPSTVAKTTPEQPKPANDSTFDNDTQVTSAAHWRP